MKKIILFLITVLTAGIMALSMSGCAANSAESDWKTVELKNGDTIEVSGTNGWTLNEDNTAFTNPDKDYELKVVFHDADHFIDKTKKYENCAKEGSLKNLDEGEDKNTDTENLYFELDDGFNIGCEKITVPKGSSTWIEVYTNDAVSKPDIESTVFRLKKSKDADEALPVRLKCLGANIATELQEEGK